MSMGSTSRDTVHSLGSQWPDNGLEHRVSDRPPSCPPCCLTYVWVGAVPDGGSGRSVAENRISIGSDIKVVIGD